jgi:predicted nucleotidyltransferase component of viral defense system
MVNIDLHRNNLITILRQIYSDPTLRTVLGFKGGTAAMLFYELPRFSVDLDFDLLDPNKKEEVLKKLKEILPQFGVVSEAQDKKYTLFFLIRYQTGERTLKVEISKRSVRSEYSIQRYLGVSMLVMKQEDMAAGKLAAFLTRKKFASRDLFDLWFFLKNNWRIDEEVLKNLTGLSLSRALQKAYELVASVKKTELLAGLGDLLDNKQKAFVKDKLQSDLLFLIKLYSSNIPK